MDGSIHMSENYEKAKQRLFLACKRIGGARSKALRLRESRADGAIRFHIDGEVVAIHSGCDGTIYTPSVAPYLT